MENETIKEIGLRISKLRTERNISQKELGSKVGVSRDIINFYETGKRVPKVETLIYLSNFFNVSTDYLLCITDNPTIKQPDTTSLISDICDYTGLSITSIEKLHLYLEDNKEVKKKNKQINAYNKSIIKEKNCKANEGMIIDNFYKKHPFCLLLINKLIENDVFEKLSTSLRKYIDFARYSHLREEYLKDLREKDKLLNDDEIEKLMEKYDHEYMCAAGTRLFARQEYDDKEYCNYLEYCISKEFIDFLKTINISEYEYQNEK